MLIAVKINGVSVKRDTAEVEYTEVLGNSTLITFSDGAKGRLRCSQTEFLKKYGSADELIHAHRKYVINIQLVTERIKYCLCKMQCGKIIELGREAHDIVIAHLAKRNNKGKTPLQ